VELGRVALPFLVCHTSLMPVIRKPQVEWLGRNQPN